MKNKKNLWFKAKMYGWGWTPTSWQGWIITLVYIYGVVNLAIDANSNSYSASDTLLTLAPGFVVLSVLFLFICYAKGERPRWRWGK